MAKVFVITGPSGVGKGTLIRALRERLPGLEISVSATTRKPRPEEEEGRDYYFMSDDEFEAHVQSGDFVEHAYYSNNRYGTLREELEAKMESSNLVVLEVELQGARQLRETVPQATQIFIAPPSEDILRKRLKARGTESEQVVQRRLETAANELAAQSEFPFVVVNDRIEDAVDMLEQVTRCLAP